MRGDGKRRAPPHTARVAHTVYECPSCEESFVGTRRCPDCQRFCRALGLGGPGPDCQAPIRLTELLEPEVTR